jgi:hypothetical protein
VSEIVPLTPVVNGVTTPGDTYCVWPAGTCIVIVSVGVTLVVMKPQPLLAAKYSVNVSGTLLVLRTENQAWPTVPLGGTWNSDCKGAIVGAASTDGETTSLRPVSAMTPPSGDVYVAYNVSVSITSAAPERVYCAITGADAPGASDSEPGLSVQLLSVPRTPQPAASAYAAALFPTFATVKVSATVEDVPGGTRWMSDATVTWGANVASGGEKVMAVVEVVVWFAASRAVATSVCRHGLIARLLYVDVPAE